MSKPGDMVERRDCPIHDFTIDAPGAAGVCRARASAYEPGGMGRKWMLTGGRLLAAMMSTARYPAFTFAQVTLLTRGKSVDSSSRVCYTHICEYTITYVNSLKLRGILRMNSKERVLNALQHRTTDRIPAARCHGFWIPEVRQSLMTRFKLRGEDTLDALLNFDVQWLEAIYRGPDLGLDDQGRPIGIWGLPEGVYTYSQQFSRPLANVQTIEQVEAYRWPGVEWFDFSTVRTLAERYQDYALVAPRSWSPIFSRIADLCGFENALMFLHTEPALIEAMVEKITEFNCAFYSNLLDAAPGLIDILLVGDDPAGQDKMLMNPIVWRRLFKPALKRIFEVAKSRGVMVMYHICGNCRAIIPDLIEIGMDVLMPLQISARDMDPAELKQEFGRDISFWGGMDVQQFLPTASPDQVRQEVRRLIDILGKDGGYVLSSSHNLLIDIPLDNILAMYDEALHYYPFS